MLDLVIHVRQDREIDGLLGQPRIPRGAVHEGHTGDALTREAAGQAIEAGLLDIFGVDRRAGPQTLRQP